jgi:hypothetical protein
MPDVIGHSTLGNLERIRICMLQENVADNLQLSREAPMNM